MTNVLNHYGFTHLITTLRKSISASDNGWSGAVCTADGLYHGRNYDLHIVDRVGGGDSFASGCLHGILAQMGAEKILRVRSCRSCDQAHDSGRPKLYL